MKKTLLFSSILGVMLLVGCQQEETALNENKPVNELPASFKEEKKELSFEVFLDKSEFKVGEDIKVTAYVENISNDDYEFGGTPCIGDLSMLVSGEQGNLTGEGSVTSDFCIESHVEHVLKKGERIEAKATFKTGTIIDSNGKETQPEVGDYKVIVHYSKEQFEVPVSLKK